MRTNGELQVQKQFLEKALPTDGPIVVFDVGANIGDWTTSLLREAARFPTRRKLEMHAFEPVPATFALLEKRLH
jgi:hypothetical protein